MKAVSTVLLAVLALMWTVTSTCRAEEPQPKKKGGFLKSLGNAVSETAKEVNKVVNEAIPQPAQPGQQPAQPAAAEPQQPAALVAAKSGNSEKEAREAEERFDNALAEAKNDITQCLPQFIEVMDAYKALFKEIPDKNQGTRVFMERRLEALGIRVCSLADHYSREATESQSLSLLVQGCAKSLFCLQQLTVAFPRQEMEPESQVGTRVRESQKTTEAILRQLILGRPAWVDETPEPPPFREAFLAVGFGDAESSDLASAFLSSSELVPAGAGMARVLLECQGKIPATCDKGKVRLALGQLYGPAAGSKTIDVTVLDAILKAVRESAPAVGADGQRVILDTIAGVVSPEILSESQSTTLMDRAFDAARVLGASDILVKVPELAEGSVMAEVRKCRSEAETRGTDCCHEVVRSLPEEVAKADKAFEDGKYKEACTQYADTWFSAVRLLFLERTSAWFGEQMKARNFHDQLGEIEKKASERFPLSQNMEGYMDIANRGDEKLKTRSFKEALKCYMEALKFVNDNDVGDKKKLTATLGDKIIEVINAEKKAKQAEAEAMRPKTHRVETKPDKGMLVCKGLYIGMHIEEAAEVLNDKLSEPLRTAKCSPFFAADFRVPSERFEVSKAGDALAIFGGCGGGLPPLPIVVANEGELVTEMLLAGPMVDAMFGVADMSVVDFTKEFAKSYGLAEWTRSSRGDVVEYIFSSPAGFKVVIGAGGQKSVQISKVPKASERKFD